MLESRAKYYQTLDKSPLQIKIHLATPLVYPDYGIHLDSILTDLVAKDLFGQDQDRWQDETKHKEIPLPLAKTDGKYPVWKASIGFTSTFNREYQDFWVKRTYDEFSGYVVKNIVWPEGVIGDAPAKSLAKEVRIEKATGPANDPSRGGFKSYYESRNIIFTNYLIFHAVGNKEEMNRLLSKLDGVGKKIAIGYGRVNGIEITEVDNDYSLFTPNNKPARAIPVEDYPNVKAQMIASPITPPYWSKKNLTICYVPTSPMPIWEWEEKESASLSFEDAWFDDELEEYEEEEWYDD